jgi:hypothetical protein
MEQYNLSLPSKEFVENNFNKILDELASLKKQIKPSNNEIKYYRNKDLKRIFGFSDNTISKYREEGTLPFTFFGEIPFYPVEEINRILEQNSNQGKMKL